MKFLFRYTIIILWIKTVVLINFSRNFTRISSLCMRIIALKPKLRWNTKTSAKYLIQHGTSQTRIYLVATLLTASGTTRKDMGLLWKKNWLQKYIGHLYSSHYLWLQWWAIYLSSSASTRREVYNLLQIISSWAWHLQIC